MNIDCVYLYFHGASIPEWACQMVLNLVQLRATMMALQMECGLEYLWEQVLDSVMARLKGTGLGNLLTELLLACEKVKSSESVSVRELVLQLAQQLAIGLVFLLVQGKDTVLDLLV